jgi:hypothetical protein
VRAALLRRRVERLEARRRPAGERVRHVWWHAGEPRPEAAPGECLVVIRWADHERDDAPSPSPEAELVPADGR